MGGGRTHSDSERFADNNHEVMGSVNTAGSEGRGRGGVRELWRGEGVCFGPDKE